MNLMLIVNELRYTCGVTNHIIHLSGGLAANPDTKIWIICGGGNGINRFSDIDVDIITDERFLHMNRSFSGYISALNFLVRFTRDNEIDIIHSHSHYAASLANRASRFTKAITVQTNHGLLEEKGRLKQFNADRYIVVNEHILEYMIENKIAPPDRINLIRCGIPVPLTPPVKSNTESGLRVIAASRFTRDKGLDTYIRAVSKINETTRQKAEFYIAGEGEMESDLRSENESLNAGVKFAGPVVDMYAMLERTHVFVYPSRSGTEGFPAVITEAGACNSLVISSDFDGASNVIVDNEDGLIFRKESADELAGKLELVINDYDSYRNIATAFYRKVKDWYDLDKMVNKHIELYKKCLK